MGRKGGASFRLTILRISMMNSLFFSYLFWFRFKLGIKCLTEIVLII